MHSKENKMKSTKRIKTSSAGVCLSYKEIKRFLVALREYPGSQSPALALSLLVVTGARKSDIFELEWERNIDLDNKCIVWDTSSSKTGYRRCLHLNEHALDVLERAKELKLEGNPYVFTSKKSKTGKLQGTQQCFDWVKEHSLLDKSLGIYDLRRSYVNALFNDGNSRHLISEILGYQPLVNSIGYIQASDNEIIEACNKVSKSILGEEESDENES